jgi:hypothetical protein
LAPAEFNAPAKVDWGPPGLAVLSAPAAVEGRWTDVWRTGAVFMEGEFASSMPSTRATVVTNNVREFRRVPGLSVQKWLKP